VTDSDWQPGPWDVTHDEYHAEHRWIGSSMAKSFDEHGPAWYREVYVDRTRPKSPPTEDMLFGTAFHVALLQPELFEAQVAREPDGLNLRKPVDREVLAKWREMNAGKITLKSALFDQITPMLAATVACPAIRDILDLDGLVERGLRWRCSAADLGIPCKCLLDVLIGTSDGYTIYDVKTAKDTRPEPFAKQALNLGYLISAAHYVEGIEQALGGGPVEFVWIVADKRPPYSEPRLYRLGREELELGRKRRLEILTRMVDCYEYDDWFPAGYGEVQDLRFPRFAWTQ